MWLWIDYGRWVDLRSRNTATLEEYYKRSVCFIFVCAYTSKTIFCTIKSSFWYGSVSNTHISQYLTMAYIYIYLTLGFRLYSSRYFVRRGSAGRHSEPRSDQQQNGRYVYVCVRVVCVCVFVSIIFIFLLVFLSLLSLLFLNSLHSLIITTHPHPHTYRYS